MKMKKVSAHIFKDRVFRHDVSISVDRRSKNVTDFILRSNGEIIGYEDENGKYFLNEKYIGVKK